MTVGEDERAVSPAQHELNLGRHNTVDVSSCLCRAGAERVSLQLLTRCEGRWLGMGRNQLCEVASLATEKKGQEERREEGGGRIRARGPSGSGRGRLARRHRRT
eukprot:1871848-Rhodomonas_salina.1